MDGEKIFKPYVGMEFDSLGDVEAFYKEFAKDEGFGIRIHTSKLASRSIDIINRVYVCCNEGHRKTKNINNEENNDNNGKTKRRCSTIRTGCEAMLRVSVAKNTKKWVVKNFNNNHNHGMVSPKSLSYIRCHKNMHVATKSLVEKFNEEGLPTGKVAEMFRCGLQEFSNRDCWNHLRNLRRKNLDVGDAQAVYNYCKRKQAEDSNFFYAIQCDSESRMVNFFWVDARSRLSYQYFGDVITFDTTYRTNKYSMPFAPFTGVNHHKQSILFGCALLQDESEPSFIWLFETWLEAMYGQQPVSIITDQDLAIGKAISKVFPKSRHRLCLWHIRKKFPEKLSHLYFKKSSFKRELKSCIRDSLTKEAFDQEWNLLMEKYKLKENDWLQGLYNIRDSWIPIYNKNTFFAGMNTTQRSESINSFFDSFVDSKTTLHDFVEKFAKAMDSRREKERKEDYESRHKLRSLKIGSKIEQHAASVYTRNIFLMFQDELMKSNLFTVEKVEKNGTSYIYNVKSSFELRDSFIVNLDLASNLAKCGCLHFDFIGILCRHILSVFQRKNIVEIPGQYILRRWTKDANKCINSSPGGSSLQIDSKKNGALRMMHVCHRASHLAYLAERYEQIYDVIMSDFDQIFTKVSVMESQMSLDVGSGQCDTSSIILEEHPKVILEPTERTIGNPSISQTKGRKRSNEQQNHSGRLKSGLEASLARASVKRRSCKVCGEHGHNRRSCKKKLDSSTTKKDGATTLLSSEESDGTFGFSYFLCFNM